jgi:two-component system, sensor histidine kinase SagS
MLLADGEMPQGAPGLSRIVGFPYNLSVRAMRNVLGGGMTVSEQRRMLVLESPAASAEAATPASPSPVIDPSITYPSSWDIVRVGSISEGQSLLRTERFDGIFFDSHDPQAWDQLLHLFESETVLDSLGEGVALVDLQLHVTWTNRTFKAWCNGPTGGMSFYDALGSPQILGPDYSPFHTAMAESRMVTTRLHCGHSNRYLELLVTPVQDAGKVSHLVCLVREVTALVQQQQQMEALHQAGAELAALDPTQLAEMSVEERVELLKLNIRRFTRDLLHYEVVEIRLLDRQTEKLEPLLEEGMTPEAAQRVLYARPQGNGVTGFVAATGKSYLCPNTSNDPLYIEGAAGAHSSLTVPLVYQDQMIGTFNVESPRLNAFGENDLQFAEIFCRDIANALHTLELLQAEKRSTASHSIEAVRREVALPVDEILGAATAVLDRYIGHDPEMADKLRQILAGARSIKQCIQRVGENLVPASPAGAEGAAPPKLKGLRVLVADSDERVRRSAHGLLGSFGCIVETARDSQEALTMARLGTYDAILVDIRLPDISGHDAFSKLRQAQPQARVILMTAFGYDPSHSIVKCRQDGLRHVLYKPFRMDQLLTALESDNASPTGAPAAPASVGPAL